MKFNPNSQTERCWPCPKCASRRTRVVDSRQTQNGIRRRRGCLDCAERWTTYEITLPPGGIRQMLLAVQTSRNNMALAMASIDAVCQSISAMEEVNAMERGA